MGLPYRLCYILCNHLTKPNKESTKFQSSLVQKIAMMLALVMHQLGNVHVTLEDLDLIALEYHWAQ